MAGPNPTQKQIAEKYKGNLDYFHKGHYYRRLRGWTFALIAIGSLAAVLSFGRWGKVEVFSTGPISENHAKFANDCQACHEGAEPDLLKVLPLQKVSASLGEAKKISLDKMKSAATEVKLPPIDAKKPSLSAEKMAELAEKGLAYTSLSNMDRACLKCHEAMNLHQPQAAALALRPVTKEMALVHSGACSSCHREHVGHQRMKIPASESCESCHNHNDQLARTRELIKTNSPNVPTRGENRALRDGIVRFLAPPKPHTELAAFKNYAEGHPPFDYEQPNLRDPAILRFNHWRHEQADIPKVNGRVLDCANCHRPGANGVFYQPITYDEHCATCHSLNLDPDIPKIIVPHGDSEKVRSYLRNLTLPYADYFRSKGIVDSLQLQQALVEAFGKLRQRGMVDGPELERRVFVTGDPPIDNERMVPRSNKGQFFPGCAKCHPGVKTGDIGSAPKIPLTNMAERWVHRGPFTHVPHQHMACLDCHGAAKTSKLTSDILMPPQKICVECHRPLDRGKAEADGEAAKLRMEAKPGSPELAAAQRRVGGVKWDCQSCHSFHAPPAALNLLQVQNK